MGQHHFILNQREIHSQAPAGMVVLDFIRRDQRLTGTKIGCREGDCGACTVLVGELAEGGITYRTMTSCLMPLANAQGKHLVTIEGLNREELTPIQQAIIEEGGSQCGFCTVGFVVSLAGWVLGRHQASYDEAIAAMDGNICRCTGYKSLERSARRICGALSEKPSLQPIDWLVDHHFLPEYFRTIEPRLQALAVAVKPGIDSARPLVAGGTDLFVQQPEALRHQTITPLFGRSELMGIQHHGDEIQIGAATTAEQLKRSSLMCSQLPGMAQFMKLVSSTPIRNMGTLGGNLVNASPIGDLSIFFLALRARLLLNDGTNQRTIPLQTFYKGYKKLAKTGKEWIEAIRFQTPRPGFIFNFEKVSKRTYLDIASVNTAAALQMKDDLIEWASLSAGGVAPVPLHLVRTSDWLRGRAIDRETIRGAASLALEEVAPISDIRGSAEYKRLLLRQLIYAHFLTLFPQAVPLEALL